MAKKPDFLAKFEKSDKDKKEDAKGAKDLKAKADKDKMFGKGKKK